MADIGHDCVILFECVPEKCPSTRSKEAHKGKRKKNAPVVTPIVPKCESWLGRVEKIKQKHGKSWGRSRSVVELVNRPANGASTIQFQFNWYKPTDLSKTEFTYDTTDWQWIDLENVICNVKLTMKSSIEHICVKCERQDFF